MAGFMQQERVHTKSRTVDFVWTLWFLSQIAFYVNIQMF